MTIKELFENLLKALEDPNTSLESEVFFLEFNPGTTVTLGNIDAVEVKENFEKESVFFSVYIVTSTKRLDF